MSVYVCDVTPHPLPVCSTRVVDGEGGSTEKVPRQRSLQVFSLGTMRASQEPPGQRDRRDRELLRGVIKVLQYKFGARALKSH